MSIEDEIRRAEERLTVAIKKAVQFHSVTDVSRTTDKLTFKLKGKSQALPIQPNSIERTQIGTFN